MVGEPRLVLWCLPCRGQHSAKNGGTSEQCTYVTALVMREEGAVASCGYWRRREAGAALCSSGLRDEEGAYSPLLPVVMGRRRRWY